MLPALCFQRSSQPHFLHLVLSVQTAYSTTIFFRNVTSKQRLKELSELYGAAEWDPLSAEKIAADGDLVEVDLLYPQVGQGCYFNLQKQ